MTTVIQAEMARADTQDLYDFVFDRLRAVRQDLVLQAAVPAQDQLFILGVVREVPCGDGSPLGQTRLLLRPHQQPAPAGLCQVLSAAPGGAGGAQ